MKMILVLMIIAIGLPSLADQGRGGADDVRCDGGIVSMVLDRFNRPILSDLFGVADPDLLESLDRWGRESEPDVEVRVWGYFKKYRPEEYKQLSNTGVTFKFVDKPLNSLGDNVHIPWWRRLFHKCHAEQLAIQDFRTHVVRIYDPALERLSQLEYVLLYIHEEKMALEATKNIPYIQMEKNARAYVRGLYLDPNFQRMVIPKMLIPVGRPRNSRYVRCSGYLKDLISGETKYVDEQRLFKRQGQTVETIVATKNFYVVWDNAYSEGQQMGFEVKTPGIKWRFTRSYERNFEGYDSVLLVAIDYPKYEYDANILCQPSTEAERWTR